MNKGASLNNTKPNIDSSNKSINSNYFSLKNFANLNSMIIHKKKHNKYSEKKSFVLDCCKLPSLSQREYNSIDDPLLAWYFTKSKMKRLLKITLPKIKSETNKTQRKISKDKESLPLPKLKNPISITYKKSSVTEAIKPSHIKIKLHKKKNQSIKPMSQKQLIHIMNVLKKSLYKPKTILCKKSLNLPYSNQSMQFSKTLL